MDEFKDIIKTGNTYLKAHMKFYIIWQFLSLILLGICIVSIYMLFGQLHDMLKIFMR